MVTGSVDDRGEPGDKTGNPPPPPTSPPLFPLPSRTSSHVWKGDASKIKLVLSISGLELPHPLTTSPPPPFLYPLRLFPPCFFATLAQFSRGMFPTKVDQTVWHHAMRGTGDWWQYKMSREKREHCVTVHPSLTNMARTCRSFAFLLFYCCNSMAENILLIPLFGSSHYLLFRYIGEELGNRGHKVRVFICC